MAEKLIQYTHLGKSGLKVSNVALGAMTFGKKENTFPLWPTQADEEKAYAIMDRYVELGGNFIDTANVYARGVSEQIVGNWLQKQDRSKIIVATKVRFRMGDDPNEIGLGRRHIMQMCDDSLKRLQTDFIDLYQTHQWDYATPIEETLITMDDLVRSGKVRYFGVSNVSGWQMQKIVDTIKEMGLTLCVSLQQQYNLMCRHPEYEEFQVCRNEGIGVLPWSPLRGGALTGKFERNKDPEASGSRMGYVHAEETKKGKNPFGWSRYAENDKYWGLIDIMKKISNNNNKTVPQIALRWLLQKNVVSSVIVGATSVAQLEDNMGAGNGWTLSDEEMEELDKASEEETPYPYGMIFPMNMERVNSFMTSSFVKNIKH